MPEAQERIAAMRRYLKSRKVFKAEAKPWAVGAFNVAISLNQRQWSRNQTGGCRHGKEGSSGRRIHRQVS